MSNERLVGFGSEYRSFTEMPAETYGCWLRTLNKIYTLKLSEEIGSIPIDFNDVCVISVGSDGKQERYPQSKTELVYLVTTNSKVSLPVQISDAYNNATGTNYSSRFDTAPNGLPSVRTLETSVFSEAFEGTSKLFPDRMLNGTFIIGNRSFYENGRRQLLYEMSFKENLSKRVRREMKNQLKEYKRSIFSGEYRKTPVFNMQNSVQFYDETRECYSTGFKVPFLRTVQRTLDLITCQLISDNFIDILKVATELPSNTIDRINYFTRLGSIPKSDIAEAYLWFLQRYHQAQFMYKATRKPVVFHFNRDEFEENKKIILDFSNLLNTSCIDSLEKT